VYRDFTTARRIALSCYRAFKKITLNLRTSAALLFLHCTHSHRHMLPIKIAIHAALFRCTATATPPIKITLSSSRRQRLRMKIAIRLVSSPPHRHIIVSPNKNCAEICTTAVALPLHRRMKSR